jgi:protein-glutamine gamma-glutamyltransferase
MQAFRLSFYLTLALAALCLGMAESFFLSWILVLVAAACFFFWLAYRYEGRWILTASAANGIGLFIGILSIGWIVSRVPRTEEEFLAQGVPWPAGMLPHLGPMLILLTAAKVFRPKNDNDFWVLQALGMMMVMLASVLAGEFHHALFLFLYLVSLFWCLTLHDRCRAAGVTAGMSVEPAGSGGPLFQPKPTGATGFGGAVLLATLAFLLGIGIFYVAPRQPANQWIPYKLSGAGALNAPLLNSRDSLLDLNHVGRVELSDEVAFDVIPQDSQGMRPNLPSDMYWRTETLDYYRRGRWLAACQQPEYYLDYWPEIKRDREDKIPFPVRVTLTNPAREPQSPYERPRDLPAEKVYLTFRLRSSMGEIVHAEHPDKNDNAGVGLWPRVGSRSSATSLVAYYDGYDAFFSVMPLRRATIAYGQVWDPATRSAPVPLVDRIHPVYRSDFLLETPPEPIGTWTRALLPDLAGITAAERTLDAKGHVAPANHVRIARALSHHLSDSGKYLYSLDLRLQDPKLDPLADFLMNVKEGHCERYASGLVLMLRGVGIPSRLVKGFHGIDKDEKGDLHVRYSHAHSWVEALVPNPNGKGEAWITLDPTPSQSAKATGMEAWLEWFNDRFAEARRSFRRNVVEFGVDEQTDWFASLGARLARPATAATLGGVLAIAAVGFVFWRRWAGSRSARADVRVDWMRSFLRLAERHCRAPRADETWSEFVASLRAAWRPSLSEDLSGLLGRFADSYDQLRFGRDAIDPAREAELADGVKRLQMALEKSNS